MTEAAAPRVLALGELLVEVMRKELDLPLDRPGELVGPFPSGAPAIFASAVARLGAPAGIIGVVGADDFGDCVVSRLRSDGVDTTHVRVVADHPTGVAFVAYSGDGRRHFVYNLATSAASLLSPGDVLPDYVAAAAFVHVAGSTLAVSRSSRESCYKAAATCKAAGGRVSFDPNVRPELLGGEPVDSVVGPLLELCSVLLPSGPEASMLTGQADEADACRSLVERGIPIVALKRGRDGSTVFTADECIDVPSLAVTEVDPTGAGDCYDAGFVVGLLQGWDPARAARFANVVGALAVTRQGPMEGVPYVAEVMALM